MEPHTKLLKMYQSVKSYFVGQALFSVCPSKGDYAYYYNNVIDIMSRFVY